MTATLAEALSEGAALLAGAPASGEAAGGLPEVAADNHRLEAELLLCAVLERPRVWLYTWPEKTLDERQWRQYRGLLEQRAEGTPVAYLLGEREFWSLPLKVSRHTLIPRPETEQLVEQALALSLPEQARVLDLGTGTGAIALALASERPQWRVTGCDFLPEAVTLARENAQALGLESVRFLRSDWFSALSGRTWDLVVANPPYIAADDPHLALGDVRQEPRSALVASRGGMADLIHIQATAPAYLAPSGWLLLEHGWTQGPAVAEAMRATGYADVMTLKDLAGQPRITMGQWPGQGLN
ncbi:MAG: peptide chain release factor N(5)-glutamine methyltransferase [Oleiphilaceae bacterium]|nr:peptide chain release factor N(5)-glutamine methyltransferase [Oleiphilaceae bacterium]